MSYAGPREVSPTAPIPTAMIMISPNATQARSLHTMPEEVIGPPGHLVRQEQRGVLFSGDRWLPACVRYHESSCGGDDRIGPIRGAS